MSTFRIKNFDTEETNQDVILKAGGPDLEVSISHGDITFNGYLLDIDGNSNPHIKEYNNKIYCVTGTIFNRGSLSDVDYIIEVYNQYNTLSATYIDGEYSAVVYDKESRTFDLFTDIWSTHQIYVDINGDKIDIFTYLDIDKLGDRRFNKNWGNTVELIENSHYRLCVDNPQLLLINDNVHKFNFDQYVDSILPCLDLFESTIIKKYHSDCTLLLSGGYDSTCVALALKKFGLSFNSITFDPLFFEDRETLNSVLDIIGRDRHILIDEKQPDFNSYIRNVIKTEFGSKVVLKGSGIEALEYFRREDDFLFPEDLGSIFPWPKWSDYGIIRNHNRYSIRSGQQLRNIFYDRDLAQAWFNTTVSIKNSGKKQLQKEYLKSFDVPIPKKISGFGSYVMSGNFVDRRGKQ